MPQHKFFKYLLLVIVCSLTSCTTFSTKSLTYQSVRSKVYKTLNVSPSAEILLAFSIDSEGKMHCIVKNLTDQIMVIDQTKSFLVNTDGNSMCYFDPTVRTTTNTNLSSSSSGASVNLGAVGGALGIGGVLGGILNGVNVGGSGTSGSSTSNTTYFADQPQISIGPYGSGAMSKSFKIIGLIERMSYANNSEIADMPYETSPSKFSACITYSTDEGASFKKIMTDFYANSLIYVPVTNHGRINASLQRIYDIKPDALKEQIWLIRPSENMQAVIGGNSALSEGIIYNYQ